jgi:hypothetical protein
VLPTYISLISAKKCNKVISQTDNFFFFVIYAHSQHKVTATSVDYTQCLSLQQKKVDGIMEEYRDIFSSPKGISTHCQVKNPIDLILDVPLPDGPVYQCSLMENDKIRCKNQYLLQKGHIRPKSSPCRSLIVLVQKKDGTWQLCIDYRALNKITVMNRYPIPRIDDLIEQLKGENFFNKIDLKSGYHQVPIEPTNVWKTHFTDSKEGLYKWLVMPFCLTNAPTNFMRLMDDVLIPFTNSFVVVYLDEILIFRRTWEDHMQNIQQVLTTLQQHRIYANLDK